MAAALILWSHAVAALVLGALAIERWRRSGTAGQRVAIAAALCTTALWALAVAGIDPRDVTARIAESARSIAWLAVMLGVMRSGRGAGYTLSAAYAAVMTVTALAAAVAVVETLALPSDAAVALATARILFRMMGAAGALVLVYRFARAGSGAVAGALALMWALDLLLFSTVYVTGAWQPMLVGIRGCGMVAVAALLVLALGRRDGEQLALSRPAQVRLLAGCALAFYLGTVALLTQAAEALPATHARLVQTAIVCGAAAGLMGLASTSWLRAWSRVMLAKHLFRHRYDYRGEWQRFATTLGRPGEAAAPLATRIVKALAEITDAPAGLLLTPNGQGVPWNWECPDPTMDHAPLFAHLAASQRIIELDAIRAGLADADRPAVSAAMLATVEAWIVVPLIHVDELVGAIVLARPPVARRLDWEDFDLLRTAGRQAASYLAEERAHAALAETQRFDEFNRRFAFIIHDIKNLASQLALVARNAERHAENPAFRADMVATLKDSSGRMATMLARLAQHGEVQDEPVVPTDVAALLQRIAAGRRAQHPVLVEGERSAVAMAQHARLALAVEHLVQNAVEASDAGSPVRLRVERIGDAVAILVSDAGSGMTAAFVRDQLFRPFVSGKAAGLGIGAYEARQLVIGMAGTLDVTSRPGEGSSFRILLPAARDVEKAA